MKIIVQYVIVVISVAFLNGCKSEEKFSIDDKFYNIEVVEVRKSPLFIADPEIYLYMPKINSIYDSEEFFTRDTSNHKFIGNDLEIQIFGVYGLQNYGISVCTCFIGAKRFNNSSNLKAFYLAWVNKNKNIDLLYSSHIGEFTDSIYTNLDYKTLKVIHPEFKGHYKYYPIKNIHIYYKYPEFYNDLTFVWYTQLDGFHFISYEIVSDSIQKFLSR
jgi:hypothetical protein